jgi:DNA-directed RNA polymerase subunit N (RpoN/RPB10)
MPKKINDDLIKKIIELIPYKIFVEIEKELCVSDSVISNIAKKNNIVPRKNYKISKDKEIYILENVNKKSITEIAKDIGVSKSCVRNFLVSKVIKIVHSYR